MRTCDICGKSYKEVNIGGGLINVPLCNCNYKIMQAEEDARLEKVRRIKAQWLLPSVRAFGGPAHAGATFADADAAVKAVENKIIPPPHNVIIFYSDEQTAREALVCISKKLIQEGHPALPADVNQALQETDWTDLHQTDILLLHGLDTIFSLGDKDSRQIFSLVNNRHLAGRSTWVTTNKLSSELPSVWGKEINRILVNDSAAFIKI